MTTPESSIDRRTGDRRAPGLGPLGQFVLYVLLMLLVGTGISWLWAHYLPAQFESRMIDPWQVESWSMKIHGGAAMVALFGAGTLLHVHMRSAWRQQRNHYSGIAMATTLFLLAASGYGLYYFNGETSRQWAEWLHWATGFGIPLMLVAHGIIGRRTR